jgi:hypothetical protein
VERHVAKLAEADAKKGSAIDFQELRMTQKTAQVGRSTARLSSASV